MKQLTLRGLDPELEHKLRTLARSQHWSLNRAALELLRRGAGLAQGPSDRGDVVGDSLDAFIGVWSADEERAFAQSIETLEDIDPALWR